MAHLRPPSTIPWCHGYTGNNRASYDVASSKHGRRTETVSLVSASVKRLIPLVFTEIPHKIRCKGIGLAGDIKAN